MNLSPELSLIVFWLALASSAIAQLAILRSTWRGLRERATPDAQPGAPRVHAARTATAPELVWAVVPAVALVFVFAGAWKAIHRVSDSSDHPIHTHPPATVSGAPSQLAVEYSAPPRRLHTPPQVVPTLERKSLPEPDHIASVEVADEPEELQR